MKNMEERRKKFNLKVLLRSLIVTILVAIFAVTSYLVLRKSDVETSLFSQDRELLRAMNYEQFLDGEENVEGTDNVKFSAFFLRDLDGDGYAEKIKGTCKEVGTKDTLYMEIIVQTEGYLKDAKIQIDGKNFYLQTALPKDNEIKETYISGNAKEICFNTLSNGTQKMLSGSVCSGDYTYSSQKVVAIGNNVNNYSRDDNRIILTGTYVDDEGNETEIVKEVTLNMDWYGVTKTRLNTKSSYLRQSYDNLPERIDEENNKIDLNFSVYPDEYQGELIINSNVVTVTIPELNGYSPIEVSCNGDNIVCNYNETTRVFTIRRQAITDDSGKITKSVSRNNIYSVNVSYPLDAYTTTDAESITLNIPVEAYYEGYNNQNSEFTNPYKSNVAKEVIVAIFRNPAPPTGDPAKINITVGKYMTYPDRRYVVKKQKPLRIYNELSSEETEDRYNVVWSAYTGTNNEFNKLVLSENNQVDNFIKTDGTYESMENLVSNVGIGFGGLESTLKEDGWVKVYDVESGVLLLEIDRKDFNKYTSSNPFYFEIPVKHIRVETSEAKADCTLTVYCVKELDDEYITENYTREEFDNLSYIKSNLTVNMGDNTVLSKTHQARYEEEFAIATISLSKDVLSTQVTEPNELIKITAESKEAYNQVGWTNGTFVVKLPKEIIKVVLNDVRTDNNNVMITSYEVIDDGDGKIIKINTSNIYPETYIITIDADITPSPVVATVSKNVELYAINEETDNYYNNNSDIYDVDSDGNVVEKVNYRTASLSLVSPNSILTNQVLGEFDNQGTVLLSPEIAELKPLNEDEGREKQTVRIGVQMKNNYASTVSDVLVLGKIPFEGNTYVVSGKNLGSQYTVELKDNGIIIPEELQGKIDIYYSENENPNQNKEDSTNGWTLKENVANWESIKTFLIDFKDMSIQQGKEYTFYYDVAVPFGIDLNKVTYSHHGIFFSLDTTDGKYKTKTEPNKIGIKIAEKYLLELNKFQKGKDKLIEGATYSVSELNENGDIVQSKTARTNSEGQILIDNLYAEKTYIIQEIKSPDEYELNNNIVSFIAHVNDETGELNVEKISGDTRGDLQVIKFRDGDNKVVVNIEDEAKATLKIIKTDKTTNTPLRGVKFKVSGANLPENGKTVTTNAAGEINLPGLKVNEEYTLIETKAEGYYANVNVRFRVINSNGIYSVEIIENDNQLNNYTISEIDSLPVAIFEIQDEKIPTYNLEVVKIKHETEISATSEEIINENLDTVTYIAGAKFKLYKGNKEIGTYITDNNGKLTIENLYQYREEWNIDQTYTLKETYAPEGYVPSKDIVFKVQKENDQLKLVEVVEAGEKQNQYVVEGNTVKLIIEDSPIFKLIKKDDESNEVLPNTKFAVYNMDKGVIPAVNSKNEIIGQREIIGEKEYYIVSTDANGEIVLDLPKGLYKIVEVEASDEKYETKNQVFYFGIGASTEEKDTLYSEKAFIIDNLTINSTIKTGNGELVSIGTFSYNSVTIDGTIYNNSGNSNTYDSIVVKQDIDGDVIWVKQIKGRGNERFTKIFELSTGEYIISGNTSSSLFSIDNTNINTNSTSMTNWLIKLSEDGEVENSISRINEATSLYETDDGKYLVPMGGKIITYDTNLNVEGERNIGGTVNQVIKTTTGEYIVVGKFYGESISFGDGVTLTNSHPHNSSTWDPEDYSDGMIIKYNSDWEAQWATGFHGYYNDSINNVMESFDGNYIVRGSIFGGSVSIGVSGTFSIYTPYSSAAGVIIKFDTNGEVIWGKYYDARVIPAQVIEKSNNNIVIVISSTKSITFDGISYANMGGSDSYLIEYDSNGNLIEIKEIVGNSTDYLYSVMEIDNKIIVSGYTTSNSITLDKINIEKTTQTEGIIIEYGYKEKTNLKTINFSTIGQDEKEVITKVIETKDNGRVAVGHFYKNVTIGNNTYTSAGYGDGLIIKYNSSNQIEWTDKLRI